MPRLRRNEVERRQRRRRQLFAVGEGSTSAAYPATPQVQILLSNGTWLDITSDVRYVSKITIRRGRSARDNRTRTATCSFVLSNLSGQYSTRVPTGGLYGLIGRNTQVRVSNLGTVRFWGEIPEWPTTWTRGSQDATTTIQAAGWLRRLTAPRQRVLKSTLRRTIGTASPAAWWPLDDSTGSSAAASGLSSGQPMTTYSLAGNNVTFGTTTDLGGSPVAPTYNAAVGDFFGLRATSMPSMSSTAWGFEFAAKSALSPDGFLMFITMANGNNIILLSQPDAVTTINLNHEIVDTAGTSDNFIAGASPLTDFNAQTWHYYAVYLQQSTTFIDGQIYIDGTFRASGSTNGTLSPPVSCEFFSGEDGSLQSTASLAFFNATTPSAGAAAFDGYLGEAAGRRVQRLCGENGVPFVAYGDLDDSEAMGAQGVDTLVGLLYDCEDADGGLLFETREQFALSYRTRNSLCNQDPAVALDHSISGHLDSAPKTRDDDQGIINKSVVKRVNGSSATFEQTVGPLGSADPPVGIGLYEEEPELNVETDAQLLNIASWRVGVGTVDEIRIEQVTVNIANMITNHGLVSLAGSCLESKIGDRLTIDNSPSKWVPPDQQTMLMVGSYEAFDQITCLITFDTIQESIYHTAILDDPVLGRAESDGSFLVSSHSAFATVMGVSIPSGPLWITTALNPDEFPFDVKCHGERWTVLSITGVASPQQFTVTRGVNGIQVPNLAGDAIVLAQPMIPTR